MSKELIESLQQRIKELEEELKKKEEGESFVAIKNVTSEKLYIPHYMPGKDGVVLAPGKMLTMNREWYETLKQNENPHPKNGKVVVVKPDVTGQEQLVQDEDITNVSDEELLEKLKLSTRKFSQYLKEVKEEGILARLYEKAKDISVNDIDGFPYVESHIKALKKRMKELNPNLVDVE